MSRAHKHGRWHRLRRWVGFHMLPHCVRENIAVALRQYAVNSAAYELGYATVTGDVAGEDQARAALKDMGLGATVYKSTAGDNQSCLKCGHIAPFLDPDGVCINCHMGDGAA